MGASVAGARRLGPVWAIEKANRALHLSLFVVAYFFAGIIGFFVGLIEQGAVTTFWIAAGLGMAAVIVIGYQAVPAILLGDMLVSLYIGFPLHLAALLALATVIEPVLGGWFLRSQWKIDHALQSMGDVAKLLCVALVAPLLSAAPGALILVASGYVALADTAVVTVSWWLADTLAIVLLTPLILSWTAPGARADVRRYEVPARVAEATILLAATAVVAATIFVGTVRGAPARAFLVFPFIIWAALRFGTLGATLTSFFIAAVALWGTLESLGPFAAAGPGENVLLLQGFVGVPAATGLLLAAALAERESALTEVEARRDELEVTVARRTEQLRHVNEELVERVDELAESNTELDAFSYSASHDLRAPLRRIDVLLEFLSEDEGPRLSRSGQETVARLRDETTRLRALVDDLLSLSRVGRAELRTSPVDVGSVARDVIGEMRRDSPDRNVKTLVAADVLVLADPGLLRVALWNLIGNAWKYTRPIEGARVEVTATRAADEVVVRVHDNGIGFPPDDAESLFKPFRRLHPELGFEGTGVGLTTVRRIVERHGGRAWAESAPGKGAAFFFTLPAASPAREA